MKVILNKDSLLSDPAGKIGFYVASAIEEAYYRNNVSYGKVEVVASPKFYEWLCDNWPNQYFETRCWVPSRPRLAKILAFFGLRNYFGEREIIVFQASDDALQEMREDMIENDRVVYGGVYHKLTKMDEVVG